MTATLKQIDPKVLLQFYKQFSVINESSVIEVSPEGLLGKNTNGSFGKRNFVTYDKLTTEDEEVSNDIETTIAIPVYKTSAIVNSLKLLTDPIDVLIEYDTPNLAQINTNDSVYPEGIAHKLTFVNSQLRLNIPLAGPRNVRCLPNKIMEMLMDTKDSSYHFSLTASSLEKIKSLTSYSSSTTSIKKEDQLVDVFVEDGNVYASDSENNWKYTISGVLGDKSTSTKLTLPANTFDLIDSEDYMMFAMESDERGVYAVVKSTDSNTFCFVSSTQN